MADRFVGTVASAGALVELLERYPADRLGGFMGSLPPGMGQRWGPVVETEDDGTTIHRRPMGGDAAGYLRLIGGPPSDGAAWEAWRVDMDLASPKSGAAAAAAGSTAMPDGADERLAAVAFAGLGLLAVLLLRR